MYIVRVGLLAKKCRRTLLLAIGNRPYECDIFSVVIAWGLAKFHVFSQVVRRQSNDISPQKETFAIDEIIILLAKLSLFYSF